jgi:hypothetical protein
MTHVSRGVEPSYRVASRNAPYRSRATPPTCCSSCSCSHGASREPDLAPISPPTTARRAARLRVDSTCGAWYPARHQGPQSLPTGCRADV